MSNDLLSFHRTYSLRKDAFGNLELVWSDHPVIERVTPVRPFPFSEPEHGLSFVDSDGHEVLWLDSINDLSTADRALVDEALAVREFMPVITRIDSVSSFNTPSTWQVVAMTVWRREKRSRARNLPMEMKGAGGLRGAVDMPLL